MFMANLHAPLDSSWKSRFSQISSRYWGGSIPRLLQLLILNSELKLKNFRMLGGGFVPRNGPVHKIWHFSRFGGVYSTTFATCDPELRTEVEKVSYVGPGGVYSTTFATCDPELRIKRFTLISFIGFPAILSTLQAFEICIFNRK